MLKVLAKNMIIVLLLALLSSQIVHAEVKLYQYDGKLPFVQMMLNMMVAMGIIDRLPSNMVYGGYNNFGRSGLSSSPWSGNTNPYARALAMRGINPGYANSALANNPFLRSPWMQSPWSQSALYDSAPGGVSPVWGTPGWGVMPYDGLSRYGGLQSDPYWSSSDLDGWVDETWETSDWNPKAESSAQTQSNQDQQAQPQQPSQNVPLVQNIYNVPANVPGQTEDATANLQPERQQLRHQGNVNNRSPLSKLAQPSQRSSRQMPAQLPGKSQRQPAKSAQASSAKVSPLQKRLKHSAREKPCVTEFCGLKKPNLNGLWVAKNGEMLGIKNERYLWSDPSERYLTGQIKIQNEYLVANAEGYDSVMRFKYKLAGDYLLTMQPNGTVREFARMPANQNYYR